MADSLLSLSNVNLFGLVMEDMQIVYIYSQWRVRIASRKGEIVEHSLTGNLKISELDPQEGDFILIWGQSEKKAEKKIINGVYRVKKGGNWKKMPLEDGDIVSQSNSGDAVEQSYGIWAYDAKQDDFIPQDRWNGAHHRRGANRELENQLTPDARLARIYGFSYEGRYYDLPKPVIFLVHGSGNIVTQKKREEPLDPHPARAPREAEFTGLAAADFDFADRMRVWSYDKADYTVRLDPETGMFEDVLLNAVFGNGGDGLDARGMNARGMNARGMNVRGMNARGMNARGGGGD